MKFRNLTLNILFFSLLFSCQKKLDSINIDDQYNNTLKSAILNFLETNNLGLPPEKIVIESKSLIFDDIKVEKFIGNINVAIIPINETFDRNKLIFYKKAISSDNVENKKYALFYLTKDLKISSANILFFNPASNIKNFKMPSNTIYNLFRFKKIETSGTFVIFDQVGKFCSKLISKDGKIFLFSNVISKSKKTISKAQNGQSDYFCIDWYLITTYFDENGNVLFEESTYLGRTCQNDGYSEGIGGGEGNDLPPSDEIIETEFSTSKSEDDIAETLTNPSLTVVGTRSPTINYIYQSTQIKTNGYITNVIVYPTTISNNHQVYIDRYGRGTTRILSVFNHANTWLNLGVSAIVNWNCMVFGRWIYNEGSPEYNRTWSDTNTSLVF